MPGGLRSASKVSAVAKCWCFLEEREGERHFSKSVDLGHWDVFSSHCSVLLFGVMCCRGSGIVFSVGLCLLRRR